MSPALAGRLLITGPPGKSLFSLLKRLLKRKKQKSPGGNRSALHFNLIFISVSVESGILETAHERSINLWSNSKLCSGLGAFSFDMSCTGC